MHPQISSNLAGKTVCVVGGSGYTGTAIAQRALRLGMKVISVSRSAKPYYIQSLQAQPNIRFEKGNPLEDPSAMAPLLKESDLVVHCIGTLIQGTGHQSYENMNRRALVEVADQMQAIWEETGVTRNLVYLSASGHPPLLTEYLTTKQAAEQHMFSLPGLRCTVLKPGFIADSTSKRWSPALKPVLSLYKAVSSPVLSRLADTRVHCLTRHLQVDSAVELDDVAYSALAAGLDQHITTRTLYNQDMERVTREFKNREYNVSKCVI